MPEIKIASLSHMTFRACFYLGATLNLLAACGSGGGSSNSMNPASDPAALQRLLKGTAPVETANEQDARARELFRRSDSRIDTAIFIDFKGDGGQDLLTNPNCSGTTCVHRYSGFTERTDLSSTTFVTGDTFLTRNRVTIESYFSSDTRQVGSTLHDSGFFSSISTGSVDAYEFTGRGSFVYGDLSGSMPPISGVWRGMMSGVLASGNELLLGNAVLNYSVSESGGFLNAEFANIVNVTRNQPHTQTNALFANIQVNSDGTFNRSGSNSRIQGGFYGSSHSEGTGVFEHLGILGAFGTKRQSQ